MGVCIGTVFDKEFPGHDAFGKFTDGKDLARELHLLDLVCFERGVMLLSTFAPDDEIYEEYWETTGTQLEPWFDTADGLRTVTAIIKTMTLGKRWAKRKKRLGDVIECLRMLGKTLKAAVKHKARFYLLYY